MVPMHDGTPLATDVYLHDGEAPFPAMVARSIKDINAPGVVHTLPSGWVNTQVHPYAWHPSIVYNAPLGVSIMANWGMGCSPDETWFANPSYLGFWTVRRSAESPTAAATGCG